MFNKVDQNKAPLLDKGTGDDTGTGELGPKASAVSAQNEVEMLVSGVSEECKKWEINVGFNSPTQTYKAPSINQITGKPGLGEDIRASGPAQDDENVDKQQDGQNADGQQDFVIDFQRNEKETEFDKYMKDKNREQPIGTKIIDELIENDKASYQNQRPFMKAQYNQCIPNPKIKGEMISVQLLPLWALGFAEQEESIEQMKKHWPGFTQEEMKDIWENKKTKEEMEKLELLKTIEEMRRHLKKFTIPYVEELRRHGIFEAMKEFLSGFEEEEQRERFQLTKITEEMEKVKPQKTNEEIKKQKSGQSKEGMEKSLLERNLKVLKKLLKRFTKQQREEFKLRETIKKVKNFFTSKKIIEIEEEVKKQIELEKEKICQPSSLIQSYKTDHPINEPQNKQEAHLNRAINQENFSENAKQTMIGDMKDAEAIKLENFSQAKKFAISDEAREALRRLNQVAIIGFWKVDTSSNEYYCYHYFYVPNPCVRECARSERKCYIHGPENEVTSISVSEVLFKGNDNEIFMLFNPSKTDYDTLKPDENQWKVGILNLEPPKGDYDKPFAAQNYKDLNSFGDQVYEIDSEAVKNIESSSKTAIYNVKANPTVFKKGKNYVLVVSDSKNLILTELGTSNELGESKELDTNKPSASKEQSNSKTLTIEKGELFVRFDKELDTLYYLQDLPKKGKNDCQLVKCHLDDDFEIQVQYERHINFDGINVDFSDASKGQFINAYLHDKNLQNEYDCITIIRQGCLALTFQLEATSINPTKEEYSLKYYIDSQICRGFFVGEDLYIERNLNSVEDLEDLQVEDSSSIKLSLYKVSNSQIEGEQEALISQVSAEEEEEEDPLTPIPSGITQTTPKRRKKFLPRDKKEVEFRLSSNLIRCLFSENGCFSSYMPMYAEELQQTETINNAEQNLIQISVTGSFIFEDVESGEVTMSIFRSKDMKNEYMPQHAIEQKWIVDYPILAYKSVTPDNKEIVLAHLSHNMPQRSIHLGKYEFASFVSGNQEDEDTRKQITILVYDRKAKNIGKEQGQYKLLIIYIDPWKSIDYEKVFDVEESIFAVKNCNIFMPKSPDRPLKYSGDKIKSIFIMQRASKQKKDEKLASLIVQFCRSIFVVSISGASTRRLTQSGKMLHKFAIQSHLNKVFFAVKNLDRSEIHMLEISQKTREIKQSLIFSLQCHLAYMQPDCSNEMIQTNKSTIFVLGQDQMLYHLQENESSIGQDFDLIGKYDYTGYEMQSLCQNQWSRCHLATGAITYDEYVYRSNQSQQELDKGQMCFFWPESKHISQDAQVYELDMRENRRKIALERVKVAGMTDTTSFIAVGREPKRKIFYECGTYFIIKPAHSSRECSLFAEERRASKKFIQYMEFATDTHILTQFTNIPKKKEDKWVLPSDKLNANKSVVFSQNGEIKPQKEEIQKLLDHQIVGQSDLCSTNFEKRARYFVIAQPQTKTDLREITILQSDETGTFEKVLEIGKTFEKLVKDDPKITKFFSSEEFKIKKQENKEKYKEAAEKKQKEISDEIEKLKKDVKLVKEKTKIEKELKTPEGLKEKNKKKKLLNQLTEDIQEESIGKSALVLNKQIRKLENDSQELDDFKVSLDDDEKRIEIMKEKLRFTTKFQVSSSQKNLVAVVQLHVAEDIVSNTNKKETPKDDDYDVYQHEITIENGANPWKIQVIFIKHYDPNFLRTFQSRLAGRYFCFRRQNEKKLRFIRLWPKDHLKDFVSQLPLQSPEELEKKILSKPKKDRLEVRQEIAQFKDSKKKPFSINLKPMIAEDEKKFIKYVTFDGIKKDSYLRLHNKEMHDRLVKKGVADTDMGFKKRHLLNVCVANTSYIFDLDESEKRMFNVIEEQQSNIRRIEAEKIKSEEQLKELEDINREIEKCCIQSDLVESVDQFYNLNSFVDIGMSGTCVYNDEDRNKIDDARDWPLLQRLITNKNTTMYFMRRKKKHQVSKDEKKIVDKELIKEYEGNFFRTYSFMDLLNLVDVRNSLRRGRELRLIPDQTILSVYDNHTIFSIFQMQSEVFEKINEQFEVHHFEDSLDAFQKPTEDQFLRKIYIILSIPTDDQCLEDERCREEDSFWCEACQGIHYDSLNEEQQKECNCQGEKPLIKKCIWYKSTHLRDQMLKMLMRCKEFDVGSFVHDIEDMNKLFETYNVTVGEAFNDHCFMYNRACESIKNIKVDSRYATSCKRKLVFSNISAVTEESIQELYDNDRLGAISQIWSWITNKLMRGRQKDSDTKKTSVQVDIKMIKGDWLFDAQGYSEHKNDFLQILNNLDKAQNEIMNSTTLIDAFLNPWDLLREIVILWVYLPFIVQSLLCLHFFSFRLAESNPKFDFWSWSTLEGVLIILFSLYFLYFEYVQFISYEEVQKERNSCKKFFKGFTEHFSNGEITNWIDLFSAILNTTLVLNDIAGSFYFIDEGKLRLMALIAIICVWYKVFYWMRLFIETAFFMNLLTKTLYAIIPFTLFLVILIFAFANMIYIVDHVDNSEMVKKEDGSMNELYGQYFDSDITNTLLYMYLLSLGEFGLDDFGNRGVLSNTLMWIIFLCGTFLLQITFMNMLIAIMGEVFGEVTEKKQQSSLTERISLLNDYRGFVDSKNLGLDAQFFFLITPSEKNDLSEDTDEKLANIKETIETQIKEIFSRQDARSEDAESKFLELKNEMHRMHEMARNETKNDSQKMLEMNERSFEEMKEMLRNRA